MRGVYHSDFGDFPGVVYDFFSYICITISKVHGHIDINHIIAAQSVKVKVLVQI